MRKAALIIMIFTLLSKILGFGRDVFLSYFFGASFVSDAYLVSLTVPSVIFGFIGVGIVTAYIPMQSRVVEELGNEGGYKFTSNFVNLILLIVSIIFVLGMTFTEPIVKVFALGFSSKTLALTVSFTKISLFGMYFTALVSIFSGYLQMNKNFIIPALVGIPYNCIIMGSMFLANNGNYIVLSIGTLIATISQFVLLIPFIKKEQFKYKLVLDIKDEKIKKTLFIALPVILGTSVNQINVLVDKTIASSLAVGSISALNYANRLNLFIQGLFVGSIIIVMYPLISTYASKKNIFQIKKILLETMIIVTIVILPMSIGAMIFSDNIVTLLFGRGAFDTNAVQMTSNALFFYSIGMLGFGLSDLMSRVFYSLQDTKKPMIYAALGIFVNIVLNIILSQYMGTAGLALATSISSIFTMFLLLNGLRKKIGSLGMKKFLKSFLKVLVASIIMGILSKLSFSYLINLLSYNIALVISIGIGGILYFIIISLFKIEEVDLLITLLKRKLNRADKTI